MSEENVRKWIEAYPVYGGGIALDIGANIGMYTDLIASKFSLVYAFEPHPDNLSLLRNNVKAPNVDIYSYAISNHDGVEALYLSSHPGCHTIMDKVGHMQTWGFTEEEKIYVPSITLDTFHSKLYPEDQRAIRFIKCDIEGGEDYIFHETSSNLFNANVIDMILEVHVDIDHERLYNYFQSVGYKIFSLDSKKVVDDFKNEIHYLVTNNKRWTEA